MQSRLRNKQCNVCDAVKPDGDFYGTRNTCKECAKARARARISRVRQTEEGKALLNAQRNKYRNTERGKARRKVENAARYARVAAPDQYKNILSDQAKSRLNNERTYWLNKDRPSFTDSFNYWLSIAPDEWLDDYYSTVRKRWHDHRLFENEKIQVRRVFDAEFCVKDRVRAAIRSKCKSNKLSTAVRAAVKRDGSCKAIEDLCGYTVKELCGHLESQFTEGMSWEEFNAGNIHIDHIKPQAAFDLQGEEEVRKCWSLENLQPLWAADNMRKHSHWQGQHYRRAHVQASA